MMRLIEWICDVCVFLLNLCLYLFSDLPADDDVTSELSEADVNKVRMDCYYADPATDQPAIVGAMAKTATARQQWVRDKAAVDNRSHGAVSKDGRPA